MKIEICKSCKEEKEISKVKCYFCKRNEYIPVHKLCQECFLTGSKNAVCQALVRQEELEGD